jgi:hypothetical protein
MVKNKTAAMEMTVGTIVTIVLLMSALVLGLILTKTIFTKTTENVDNIDAQVKGEINDLFGEEGTGFVIRLGNQNTAKVRQGTENFGIPIGFSPQDSRSWGSANGGCRYTITAENQPQYCMNNGWANPESYIKTGTKDVMFGGFENYAGYSLIKIDIPESVPPCLQRFNILVTCKALTSVPAETRGESFDIEVLKRGLF